MIKTHITRFHFYNRSFPDDKEVAAALKVLKSRLTSKNDELYKKARSSVKPVKHVIKITPK